MKNQLRWGVLGSGGIARRRTIPEGIVPAKNSRLVAVYDVAAQVNEEVAVKFQAKAVGRIEDLFTDEIDAVYVATPASLHYEQAISCACAKKHVLCEKPLGLSNVEAEKMISSFQDNGVVLGVGFMMRFSSQHKEALRLIREGMMGTLTYGRAQLSCWYPPMAGAWRQNPSQGGGGSLMDMGGHCIDLLEMFFGKITRVSCFVNNTVHTYRSEDSAAVLLFFENDAIATVDAFFCIPDNSSKNVLELYGSKGSIIAQGTIGQNPSGTMMAYLEGRDAGYDTQQQRTSQEGIEISPDPVNTYQAEIEEFSAAILEGREPYNNAQLGMQSQKILTACYESANTGKAICVK